ncbi:MAG: xanthine dehydrogenase family protein molybdopterin-binding subunit [Acidobacteriota bacterium]|nr:xanthine dehydrogenase family protein molybdopterin-binding subunit [Acidobacteriota bacterium]
MRRMPHLAPGLDRRQVLKGSLTLGAGLVIGLRLPRGARAQAPAGGEFVPNAFVRIAPDNSITVLSKHIEFGQGTYTGLATVLAEELDADWADVRVEAAPADVERYKNLFFGVQGTGGSTAMANSWEQMRRAGATARALLVAAAADEWGVATGEIDVANGIVSHRASGRSAHFGELVKKAATMEPPTEVELKDPATFTLIGRESLPRVDVPAKSRGTAQFTFDVDIPGMLTAVIARSPRFGGTVASFDAAKAKKVPGVVDVVAVPQGVAVLAKGFWAAKKGRSALEIEWDDSTAEKRGSAEIFAEYRVLLDQPGLSARADGDADAALAGAARQFSADYEFPFLAHAPMEPLDCVIQMSEDGCDVWAGSQLQTIDQGVVAGTLGIEPQKVRVHTLLGGGSFGRRATPNADVYGEAAAIVKATGGKYPVKLVWTREDDIRGGRYRPLFVHRLRAGLNEAGDIVAWSHRLVGQSIVKGTAFEGLIQNGIDATSVEGAQNLPYAISNLAVDLHTTDVGVPVLWWRSVGHTHTAYSTETFLDEVIHAAGKDPVAVRRQLLAEHPRHLAVLNLAAEKAAWGSPLPAGTARGVAVHESFSSFVAQVVEVTLADDGMPKVERVVCAVDCGIAINPDIIRAQMESGIGYGLGAALHNEIVVESGRVRESNFHNYKPLRIHEMPPVEVHIVESKEAPTGVGEPGVPPIAPAVANAMFALTGQRVHRLPFRNAIGKVADQA